LKGISAAARAMTTSSKQFSGLLHNPENTRRNPWVR
jgi:hypothetical protein